VIAAINGAIVTLGVPIDVWTARWQGPDRLIRPRRALIGTLSGTFDTRQISQPTVGTPGVTSAPRHVALRGSIEGPGARRACAPVKW